MLSFVVKYVGFLKRVPGLAILFDSWLKLWMLLTRPEVLNWIGDIEDEALTWEHTTSSIHKYGGLQLNCRGSEIGHIHSDGLVDILLSRNIKQQLMKEGRVKDHHLFKNSGWISFNIRTAADKDYALYLLRRGYQKQVVNS